MKSGIIKTDLNGKHTFRGSIFSLIFVATQALLYQIEITFLPDYVQPYKIFPQGDLANQNLLAWA